ncbi:MAG TPA: hypothetical protein VJ044_12105, partial [Candidatus Hodarchaeales archaeon]|nr:hypothetical protein [Candidatus Hodarchaeales archaeon]
MARRYPQRRMGLLQNRGLSKECRLGHRPEKWERNRRIFPGKRRTQNGIDFSIPVFLGDAWGLLKIIHDLVMKKRIAGIDGGNILIHKRDDRPLLIGRGKERDAFLYGPDPVGIVAFQVMNVSA